MNSKNKPLQLLNGLTPAQFLVEYWQKKPLLIKNSISNFTGLLSPDELAGLACEDEVQSRIVKYKKGNWTADHGPFDEDDFANAAHGDKRSIQDLLTELAVVRQATLSLFKTFDEAMLQSIGTASNNAISVRAIGFVIIGHQNHHQQIFQERYLS